MSKVLGFYRSIGCLLLLCCTRICGYANMPVTDFTVKGIYIDLRTQVMTVPALKEVAGKAAAEGINTLIMEYEATFPFDKHATLCNAYHYTVEEITEFVQYCSSLGMDVIPLQNCFGHCEYILRHDRYAKLRESKTDMSQVCPMNVKKAKSVFGELFKEVARLHPSPYFHIGADETRLLGHCKSCKQKVDEEGISKLFVDYVKEMCELVIAMGKKPIIWADMILQHPEALNELPSEIIVVDWNYGWSPNHFGNVDALVERGLTVWGASALRSSPDNIYLTQWNKHFENLETFLPFAREHGYEGIINTSWSTSGRYGYIYDNDWEVVELQPIRQVYPMSGFDILQRAYADALKEGSRWDAKTFIRNYGKEHFGFADTGQVVLLEYMLMPQEKVTIAKMEDTQISQMLVQCETLRGKLAELEPTYHKEDWLHLQLMLDIRINYLKFKGVEKLVESDGFNASMRQNYAAQLEQIEKESRDLCERFYRLNVAYLKNPAESFGKWDYVQKMQRMCRYLTLP